MLTGLSHLMLEVEMYLNIKIFKMIQILKLFNIYSNISMHSINFKLHNS